MKQCIKGHYLLDSDTYLKRHVFVELIYHTPTFVRHVKCQIQNIFVISDNSSMIQT